MKKKIDLFWYWFIFVVAFVLCFFAINQRKVDAYFLNENGNIQSDNLIDYNNYTFTYNNFYSRTSQYVYNEIKTIYSEQTGNTRFGVNNLNFYGNFEFKEDTIYTFSFEKSAPYSGNHYVIGFEQTQTSSCPGVVSTADNSRFYYSFNSNCILSNDYTFNKGLTIYLVNSSNPSQNVFYLFNFMLYEGSSQLPYVPYEVWYNESLVGDLATGVISYSSASLTYDNRDYGTSHSIADVSSYIDSSFGFIYFDRLWQYLDTLTSSEYENAWLTLQLNNKMNLNTTYILNAMFNNGNYGVGVKFYQGENLILNVTNWINNNYAYCSETSGATCSVQLSNFVNVGDKPDLQNSFTYFDKIEIWSGDTDKRTGSFGFQNISYNQGYNSGYNIGYSTGVSTGENTGYNKGYNSGYLYGYEKGVDAVEGTDNTLVGLVGGILTAPVNMLKTIFDFEFLGINLTHFIFSIVSLFIVIWLIKVFL